MNDYEAKKQARIDRLRARAAAKRSERDSRHGSVARLAEVMNGQPVLVGHHSEKRHRRDLDRMSANMRKCVQLGDEASRLEARARAAETSTAVSSDDPEAMRKLKEKIAAKERFREQCKGVNAKIRAAKRAAKKGGRAWQEIARELLIGELDLSEATADRVITPDVMGDTGVPSYVLTNCGAEIRRLRKRLEQLERAAERDGREEQIGEVRICEEENRVRVFFPGKPSAEIRKRLKGDGFRWAPSVGAWQRHASEGAWFRAREIAGKIEVSP